MDGYSYGKIILSGEHSVVYGKPALAIPFYALRSEVVLTPASIFLWETKYFNGPLSEGPSELEGLYVLLRKLFSDFPRITPVNIGIRSNLPEKSGLGSSASIARALVDAFNNHFNLGLTKEDYLAYLSISENVYHHKASGIDASVVIYETPLLFIPPKISAFPLSINGFLVAFYSNTNSATKEAVAHVSHHDNRDELVNELEKSTLLALEAVQSNDFNLLCTSFNKSHETLRELGVSSPALETLRAHLLANSAEGVKITGGGMGGCLIALFKTKESAERAQNTLKDYSSWLIDLGKLR